MEPGMMYLLLTRNRPESGGSLLVYAGEELLAAAVFIFGLWLADRVGRQCLRLQKAAVPTQGHKEQDARHKEQDARTVAAQQRRDAAESKQRAQLLAHEAWRAERMDAIQRAERMRHFR